MPFSKNTDTTQRIGIKRVTKNLLHKTYSGRGANIHRLICSSGTKVKNSAGAEISSLCKDSGSASISSNKRVATKPMQDDLNACAKWLLSLARAAHQKEPLNEFWMLCTTGNNSATY
jgi:hypothetical protein